MKLKLKESELKELIASEIGTMIENGELDEGILDRIGARVAGAGTRLKGAAKSLGQKAGAAVTGAQAAGVRALGGDDEKLKNYQDFQKQMGTAHSADAKDQSKSIQAKKILSGKLKKLSRLNLDLQNDIKTLGLGDDQRIVKSLQQLENALVAISTLVHGDEKAQPAAQQQAAAE